MNLHPSPIQPSLSKLDTGVVDERRRRARWKKLDADDEEAVASAASRRTAEDAKRVMPWITKMLLYVATASC